MRIRTIDAAFAELKAKDPDTAITRFLVREIISTGQVPSMRKGTKFLVNMDVLEDFLAEQTQGGSI